jgi:hypothetical protein
MSVPFFWGAITCALSVVFSIIYAIIDIFGWDKHMNSKSDSKTDEKAPLSQEQQTEEIDENNEGDSHGGKIDFRMIKDMNEGTLILCIVIVMLAIQTYYLFS